MSCSPPSLEPVCCLLPVALAYLEGSPTCSLLTVACGMCWRWDEGPWEGQTGSSCPSGEGPRRLQDSLPRGEPPGAPPVCPWVLLSSLLPSVCRVGRATSEGGQLCGCRTKPTGGPVSLQL